MNYDFGTYHLDTQRYELARAGVPIPLRPKVFQVLAYLLAHPDRVVSKEELLEQLWPGQFVGDVGLNSYIMAVRKALGDRRLPYQYIRTVRGHGYRFVAAVTTAEQTLPAHPAPLAPARAVTPPREDAQPEPAAMRAPVVGREAELAQLAYWWERAQGGERHLVFVTGEPGIGKTTLIDAWLARLAGEAPLWIGRGQCVETYGAGEPYRPVLVALGRLGRGPRGQEWVALLGAQAPTWLVLEDLHWSDPSTLDLLAVLARRREPARLLLLGTYRPSEVRRQAHPLAAVIHELQLHGHSLELPVTMLAEDAIAAYLTHRLPGLPCVDVLARLVHQHTEGNPLFMVTLVEAWMSQRVLREEDGAWVLQVGMEALRDQVPDSLRQMIEGQFDRLSAAEQRVLEAASVAGVEFATAAVAAGLGQTVERVDEACAVLARHGQWLRAVGEQSWPDGTVAGGYRFSHALYQQVLYRRVAAARRVWLHQRIGVRAEAGYGAEAGARAAELAVHFERGRDYPRAVQYLRRAGENANRRSAHLEAIQHLTQGLALLATLPETPARDHQELDLQLALGSALMTTKGPVLEVEQAYARAHALCQQVGETPQLFPLLQGLSWFYETQGGLQTARELGEQLVRLAQRVAAPTSPLEAHTGLGTILFHLGDYTTAWTHLAQGLLLADPAEQRVLALRSGLAPGVRCLVFAASTLWCSGYSAQAVRRSQEALALAQTLAHPYSLVLAQHFAAHLYQRLREALAVQAQAEVLLTLATAQGFPLLEGVGIFWRGVGAGHAGPGYGRPGADAPGNGHRPGHGKPPVAATLSGLARRSHRARRQGRGRIAPADRSSDGV